MEEFLDNEQKKTETEERNNKDDKIIIDPRTGKPFPETKRYFYKDHPTDKVYWVTHVPPIYGDHEFSFDKKKDLQSIFGISVCFNRRGAADFR